MPHARECPSAVDARRHSCPPPVRYLGRPHLHQRQSSGSLARPLPAYRPKGHAEKPPRPCTHRCPDSSRSLLLSSAPFSPSFLPSFSSFTSSPFFFLLFFSFFLSLLFFFPFFLSPFYITLFFYFYLLFYFYSLFSFAILFLPPYFISNFCSSFFSTFLFYLHLSI